ncbi:MAG: VOC family protein [Candidatus Sericytochromatia bacterium]
MKFRVARHTNNIDSIINFYRNILGLEILGEFKNHDNYDGIFLGFKNKDWHLEFTVSNEKPIHNFDDDDLLVFYCDSQDEYQVIKDRFRKNHIEEVQAKNPYWNLNGITYLDPDGFRVVISLTQI